MLEDRTFFFDTNVLLYLFYTQTIDTVVRQYTSLFSRMLKQKNELFIDNTILSEFINRAIRLEYNNSGLPIEFKEYRDSDEGQRITERVYRIIRNVILARFKIDNETWKDADIERLLIVDSLDYNDKAIAHLCALKGHVLVTNDKRSEERRVGQEC